jgi:D-alanyl-D-alanine dipeptidase
MAKSIPKKLFQIFLIFIVLNQMVEAQVALKVVDKTSEIKSSIKAEPKLALVELKSVVTNIRYDLKYATKDNFTGIALYPRKTNTTYLRVEPAIALGHVAEELKSKGLGIHIWDAFRPYHVTVKFWELIKDDRYVANPSKGSGHNRGIAIDLTLYNLTTGELLDMPTGYDDFSEQAHHGNETISEKKKVNRELLRSVMEKNGFLIFQTEWWHYYWPNGEQYDVLDFSFRQIERIK